MAPRAGNLWHRVAFYEKSSTRDSYGASSDSWALSFSTRGEIRYYGGNRTLSSEEKFYSKSMELIIRYRSDVVETMKVLIDGGTDYYVITYIEPVGRNESLRITLEKENA
jgi:head-tail adaptor